MKKIRTGKIFAVVSAIMLLVSAFAVTSSAAAPKDGQLYPMFLLGDKQPQYSFWYTGAAAGTDPMKGATVVESLAEGNKVTYENDNTINLIIDKSGDKISRGAVAFTAPADGEYSVEFSAGLWWEGAATSYAIEVYVDGKLVEGSHKEFNGGSWGSYSFTGIRARTGKVICIVPCAANEGGALSDISQPLKLTNYKLNFVKSATFEPDTPTPPAPPTPDTSDGIIAAAVTLALCGAAVAIAKKVHR